LKSIFKVQLPKIKRHVQDFRSATEWFRTSGNLYGILEYGIYGRPG